MPSTRAASASRWATACSPARVPLPKDWPKEKRDFYLKLVVITKDNAAQFMKEPEAASYVGTWECDKLLEPQHRRRSVATSVVAGLPRARDAAASCRAREAPWIISRRDCSKVPTAATAPLDLRHSAACRQAVHIADWPPHRRLRAQCRARIQTAGQPGRVIAPPRGAPGEERPARVRPSVSGCGWGPLIALVVLCDSASPRRPRLRDGSRTCRRSPTAPRIPLVLAVGMTFVILQGSIDLSIEGVMAASSLTFAMTVLNSRTGLDLGVLGILAGDGASAPAFGLLNGLVVTKLRVPSFMVTLGVWSVSMGIAMLLSGGQPPIIRDETLRSFGLGATLGVPNLAIVAILVLGVGYVLQTYTRFGRYSYVIGGGEDLARLSGIPVDRYKVLVFAFSGLLAGLAGVMESARIGLGHVDIGLGQMFAAITAVVIGGTSLSGGRGGVLQSAVGVLILVVLANGMIFVGISPYVQKAVQGGIILYRDPDRDLAPAQPAAGGQMSEPVLRVENLSKRFPGPPGARRRVGRDRRARGRRPRRRERRRQVDAAQGARRALSARQRAHRPSRQGSRRSRSVAAATDAGIGMVFQEQSLLPNITVAENILLGYEDGGACASASTTGASSTELAAAQLAKLGSDIAPARGDGLALLHRAPGGRARQGAVDRGAHAARADHAPRRADLGARSRGGRDRARPDQASPRARLGRLRLASARRGAARLRPRLCDDQWPAASPSAIRGDCDVAELQRAHARPRP